MRDDFVPSRDKLEAVNRISALANGGPEELGRGSKERKQVLVKVVDFLQLPVNTSKNKVELAASIADALGGTWTSACSSTGYTITLVGLDLLLCLAQAESKRRGLEVNPRESLTLEQEAQLLLECCAPHFHDRLDIRNCVTNMQDRADRNWAQSEWPGFYFEGTARAACMSIAGGEPGPRIGSVEFDYELLHVWDFKAHSVKMASGQANPSMILNSVNAVYECINTHNGVGFIVAHGAATYDVGGDLRAWMAEMKARGSS